MTTIHSLTRRYLSAMAEADHGLVRIVPRTTPEPAWWHETLTPAQLDHVQSIADQAMDDTLPDVTAFLTEHPIEQLTGLVAAGAIDVQQTAYDYAFPLVRFEIRTLDTRPSDDPARTYRPSKSFILDPSTLGADAEPSRFDPTEALAARAAAAAMAADPANPMGISDEEVARHPEYVNTDSEVLRPSDALVERIATRDGQTLLDSLTRYLPTAGWRHLHTEWRAAATWQHPPTGRLVSVPLAVEDDVQLRYLDALESIARAENRTPEAVDAAVHG